MQNPAHDWKSKQILSRQEIYSPFKSGSHQRRINEAGMVCLYNYRSFQRHALRIIDPPSKIELVNGAKEKPAKEIKRVHWTTDVALSRWLSRFLISAMIRPLV